LKGEEFVKKAVDILSFLLPVTVTGRVAGAATTRKIVVVTRRYSSVECRISQTT
jgi:hypothetical protein